MSAESFEKPTKTQASGIRRRRISSPVPNLGPVPNSALEKAVLQSTMRCQIFCRAEFGAARAEFGSRAEFGVAYHMRCRILASHVEFGVAYKNSASRSQIPCRISASRALWVTTCWPPALPKLQVCCNSRS